MSDKMLAQFGNHYFEFRRSHPDAAEDFKSAIEELLTDAGVTFDRVTARVKEWSSLKAKARRKQPDGSPLYPHPESDIHDLIGVRIITFHPSEIPSAIRVLKKSFPVRKSVDKAAETRVSGGFGYGSHHLILEVDSQSEDLEEYVGRVFEVQIRTVLQHGWAEFEHDIRYKRQAISNDSDDIDPEIDRLFTLAAGLIELADQQFDKIAALKIAESDTDLDIELTSETLPGVLAMLVGNRFPRPRSENYRFLHEILTANGITSIADLSELLSPEDIDELMEVLHYRFQPGQIRIIDDLLLKRFGQGHIDATVDLATQSGIKKRKRQMERKLDRLTQATSNENPTTS